jgi:Resolvase, N terminal domain
MRASVYARVSTVDQEPENQLQEVRRCVQARDWTAVEYVDRRGVWREGSPASPSKRWSGITTSSPRPYRHAATAFTFGSALHRPAPAPLHPLHRPAKKHCTDQRQCDRIDERQCDRTHQAKRTRTD